MNCEIKIRRIESLEEIEGYWTTADYRNLLGELNFPDSESLKPTELREMLFMAINDFEPREAATILLQYKLGEDLTEGQIENISHEMMEDKVAEQYPEISLHYDMFSVNQLLRKAYNGKFPNTIATKIELELTLQDHAEEVITKEIILKGLANGLSSSNLIKRLFTDQLEGKVAFDDAENILWELHKNDENLYTIITSDNWISADDIPEDNILSKIELFEEEA